jgi:hypothetical protein
MLSLIRIQGLELRGKNLKNFHDQKKDSSRYIEVSLWEAYRT